MIPRGWYQPPPFFSSFFPHATWVYRCSHISGMPNRVARVTNFWLENGKEKAWETQSIGQKVKKKTLWKETSESYLNSCTHPTASHICLDLTLINVPKTLRPKLINKTLPRFPLVDEYARKNWVHYESSENGTGIQTTAHRRPEPRQNDCLLKPKNSNILQKFKQS